MEHGLRLHARERRLLDEIRAVLGGSLELCEVLEAAFPVLLRLVSADHAALGVSRPGSSEELEWFVADLPSAFFAGYPEMAPHDFVRRSVLRTPGRVLRDSEMVPRRELEANMMYRRARELGTPLEQVMGVMLHAGPAWIGGLAVYRARRRPFSDRERVLLQELVPALSSAVQNCRVFADTARRARVLDELLAHQGLAALVLAPPAREIARTQAASTLLDRWFAAGPGTPGVVPEPLLELIGAFRARAPNPGLPIVLECSEGDADRVIRPYWMGQESLLALVLEEAPRAPELPAAWCSRLTPRQREVARLALKGWDNRLIAAELRCSLGTVKKHLQHVFDRLGVASRARLIASGRLDGK